MGKEAIGNYNLAASDESLKTNLATNGDAGERLASEAVSTTGLEVNPTPEVGLEDDNSLSKMNEAHDAQKIEHHGQLIDANSENLLALVKKCTGIREMGLKEDDLKRLFQLMIKAPDTSQDEKKQPVVVKQKKQDQKNPEKKIQIENTATVKDTQTDEKAETIIKKDMKETVKLSNHSIEEERSQLLKTELKQSDHEVKIRKPPVKEKTIAEKPLNVIADQKEVAEPSFDKSDEGSRRIDYQLEAMRNELANRTIAANLVHDNYLIAEKHTDDQLSTASPNIKPIETEDANSTMISEEADYSPIKDVAAIEREPRAEIAEPLPDNSAIDESEGSYLTGSYNTLCELEDNEFASIEESLQGEDADLATELTVDVSAIENELEPIIDFALIETDYPATGPLEDISLSNIKRANSGNEDADLATELTVDVSAIENELEPIIDFALIETDYPATGPLEDIGLNSKTPIGEAQIVDLSLEAGDIKDFIIDPFLETTDLVSVQLQPSVEDYSSSSPLDPLIDLPQYPIYRQAEASSNDSLVEESTLDLSNIGTQEARFLTKSKVLASKSMFSAKQLLGIFAVLSATSI